MQDQTNELVTQLERMTQAFIDLMGMVGVSKEDMDRSPIVLDARQAIANATR